MTRTGNFDTRSASARPESAEALNPSVLTVEQVARMLGVAAEVVRRHVREGAPADFAGRMNLIHYAAWLNARLAADEPGNSDEPEEANHGD